MIIPTAHRRDAPIVKDGGATVTTAVALSIISLLSQLLPGINHHRTGGKGGSHDKRWTHKLRIAGKLLRSKTLLVVIFKEIEHMGADAVDRLPTIGDLRRRDVMTLDAAKLVVEVHLIIKIVEAASEDIVAIDIHIIQLGNKLDFRIFLFHIRDCPFPKLHRHHMHHIATEAIHTLCRPKAQNVEHLQPSVGDRTEMGSTVTVVDAVVEFHSLIPIILSGKGIKTIVA